MKPLKRSSAPWLPEPLRWRTVKVTPGTHQPYMVAGPGWEGIVHHTGTKGRTVPCVAELTSGELHCENCKYGKRYGCYLPVFTCMGGKQTQIVLQGAKRTYQTWSVFKPGELVAVCRGKAERDTILFTPAGKTAPTVDLSVLRAKCPVDIDAYLLHLWQDRTLAEWQGAEWHPSCRTLDNDRSLWVLKDGSAKPLHET